MPGQREREAVEHPDPALVAADHRRQPPPQPAAVELQLLLGPEGGEHLGALVLGELVERQLVVVADEVRPLAVLGDLRQRRERVAQRRRVPAREREVHRLVDDEREDHVQLVAVLVAEERPLLVRRQVDLAHQDRVAAAAADEAAQVAQQLVRVVQRALRQPDRLEQERDGVDAEAGQALVEPVADDLRDLVAHGRVRDVEVRLVGVEAVQVPLPRLRVPGPVGLLPVGEHDVAGLLRRASRRPRRRSRGSGEARSRAGLEPRVLGPTCG